MWVLFVCPIAWLYIGGRRIAEFGYHSKNAWPSLRAALIVGIMVFGSWAPLAHNALVRNAQQVLFHSEVPFLLLLFHQLSNVFGEETVTRGLLQSAMAKVIGQKASWIFTGLIFSLVHLGHFKNEPPLAAAFVVMGAMTGSLFCSWLRYKYDNIYGSLLFHLLGDLSLLFLFPRGIVVGGMKL